MPTTRSPTSLRPSAAVGQHTRPIKSKTTDKKAKEKGGKINKEATTFVCSQIRPGRLNNSTDEIRYFWNIFQLNDRQSTGLRFQRSFGSCKVIALCLCSTKNKARLYHETRGPRKEENEAEEEKKEGAGRRSSCRCKRHEAGTRDQYGMNQSEAGLRTNRDSCKSLARRSIVRLVVGSSQWAKWLAQSNPQLLAQPSSPSFKVLVSLHLFSTVYASTGCWASWLGDSDRSSTVP